MKKLLSSFSATALAASFMVSSMAPVNAAPIFVPTAPTAQSNVIQIRDRHNFRHNDRRGWWNGHRGYRHYRRGYRRHGDFWFPLAAFAAGALITGAINNNTRVYSGGNAHVAWCYDRYRSYRASDNTFQPYHGPRQQCYSPYS